MKRPANVSKGNAPKKQRSSKTKPRKHGKPSKTFKKPSKPMKKLSKPSTSAPSNPSQKPIESTKNSSEPQSNGKDDKKITIPTNHREQKLLRLERKAARSPMFEVVQELNKLYEQIRIKRVPKDERNNVIEKCFNVVRGHMLEVIFKHDASRVVQMLIKYTLPDNSNPNLDRMAILKELQGHYVELAKSPYGRFVVLKALKYAPSQSQRSEIVKEFEQTNLAKLLSHVHAGTVVDTIYAVYATSQQQQSMAESFYGTEYALIKQNMATKSSFSATIASSPSSRDRVIAQMRDNLTPLVEKASILDYELFHRVLWDYISLLNLPTIQANLTDATSLISSLMPLLAHFVHTRPGASLLARLIACGSAKSRKNILKVLKPHIAKMFENDEAWFVLLLCASAVDDTVLLNSTIWSDSLDSEEGVKVLLTSKQARRVVAYLVNGITGSFFSPEMKKRVDEEMNYVKETSKKEDSQRRKEQLKVVIEKIVGAMNEELAYDLITGVYGAPVLLDVLKYMIGESDLTEKATEIMKMICDTAAANPIDVKTPEVEEDEEDDEENSGDSDLDSIQGDDEQDDEENETSKDEIEEGKEVIEAMDEDEAPELEVSKHYLAEQKPEPVPKTPILFEYHGSRMLKRFVHELPEFGNLLLSSFKTHDTMKTLFEHHEENLPTPYFVMLSLLECKLGEVKNVKSLIKKAMKSASVTDSENKGVQKLKATLDA